MGTQAELERVVAGLAEAIVDDAGAPALAIVIVGKSRDGIMYTATDFAYVPSDLEPQGPALLMHVASALASRLAKE